MLENYYGRIILTYPILSIIIPTKNSRNTINACLNSIFHQNFTDFEIIVIDSKSTDGTIELLKKYGIKTIITDALRSQARNIGARIAMGKYLLFIDSDMMLNHDVITDCISELSKYTALIIPEVSTGIGFWAKCKMLEKKCYLCDENVEAARCFSKFVFEQVGGYNEDLEAGEDWQLHDKIINQGYSIGRIKSKIIHNEGNLFLINVIKRKYYYGTTYDRYRVNARASYLSRSPLFRRSIFIRWRKCGGTPSIFIGLLFMKTCEIIAGGIGIIKGKLQ